MKVRHRHTPIGHRTIGIGGCYILKYSLSLAVPEGMQQSHRTIEFRLQLLLTGDCKRNRAEFRARRHRMGGLVLLSQCRQDGKGRTQKRGYQQASMDASY